MKATRRSFFKGLAGLAGALALGAGVRGAAAGEPRPARANAAPGKPVQALGSYWPSSGPTSSSTVTISTNVAGTDAWWFIDSSASPTY